MRNGIAVALMMSVFACGGTTGPTGPTSSNCSVTLSGGVTGTYTCTIAAVYDAASQQSAIAVTVSAASGIASFAIGVSVAGTLTSKTYAWSDCKNQNFSVVTTGYSSVWEADSTSSIGSSTFTVTSLSDTNVTANGSKVYALHGLANGTLAAQSGATGTVTAAVSF